MTDERRTDLAERVRALEVRMQEAVRDLVDVAKELERSRGRLHSLENTTAALVHAARERTAGEERRNRERINAENARAAAFGRRVSILTLAVAAAAVIVPLATLILHFVG